MSDETKTLSFLFELGISSPQPGSPASRPLGWTDIHVKVHADKDSTFVDLGVDSTVVGLGPGRLFLTRDDVTWLVERLVACREVMALPDVPNTGGRGCAAWQWDRQRAVEAHVDAARAHLASAYHIMRSPSLNPSGDHYRVLEQIRERLRLLVDAIPTNNEVLAAFNAERAYRKAEDEASAGIAQIAKLETVKGPAE